MFRVLKLLSLIISVVLGLFCDSDNSGGLNQPVEYGMPHADYKISGKVISSGNSLPVEGLRVSIRDTVALSTLNTSAITDSDGRYSLEFTTALWNNTWHLQVKDIDSIENGLYKTKDTTVSIPQSELNKRGGRWNYGHADKTIDLKVDRTN